jgi:hypothetical protein
MRRLALVGLPVPALAISAYLWLRLATERPVDVLIDFQLYRFGVPPLEFDYDATGPHGPVESARRPMWRTFVDRFAPSPDLALIQASTLPDTAHYPLALLRGAVARDVTLSVFVKPMGGTVRQGAGVVWRARDRNNYYAALAEPRDHRLHLLAVVAGRPRELAAVPIAIKVEFERRTPSPTWGWYALSILAEDERLAVWFQGERVVDVVDTTLRAPGHVGLITHADAVALFDDLHVRLKSRAWRGRSSRRGSRAPRPPLKGRARQSRKARRGALD